MFTCLCEVVRGYALRRGLRETTTGTYLAAVRSFSRWLGRSAGIGDLEAHANEYLASVTLAPESIRGYRTVFRAILKAHGAQVELRVLRRRDVVPVAFTREEISHLLRHATPIQRAAINLAYDACLRRGDLFKPRWPQVHGDVLYLVQGKSGRRILRRLRPETIKACMDIAIPEDDRLVPWPFGLDAWSSSFRKFCRRVGITAAGPGLQMIRRSAASYAAAAGQNAAELLGHAPGSGDLARRYYLDPRITDVPPPLPPAIG